MHKQERFDRDHVRSHKASRDQTFTIERDAKPEKQDDKEEEKDAILFTGHQVHHVFDHDVDTSDSEDDWEDY